MKKLFLLLAVAGLIFTGCSDLGTNPSSNPVTTANSNTISLNKSAIKTTVSNSTFIVSQIVNGKKGGIITLNQKDGNVHASAKLDIPKNAFDGKVNITITVDPSTASVTLSPSMTFQKDLTLDAAFKGLDLKAMNLDSKKVNFYYFTEDGSKVPVKHSLTKANVKLGELIVKHAEIDHFSRYGWAK
jgi:uncharacterized lipoprotein YajG